MLLAEEDIEPIGAALEPGSIAAALLGPWPMDRKDMVEIAAGRFTMGSAAFYPEEAPVRDVQIGAFAIDRGPVTVTQFTRFVADTA
jgi:formylglycine-generating enzyme required for sulfatase activity